MRHVCTFPSTRILSTPDTHVATIPYNSLGMILGNIERPTWSFEGAERLYLSPTAMHSSCEDGASNLHPDALDLVSVVIRGVM